MSMNLPCCCHMQAELFFIRNEQVNGSNPFIGSILPFLCPLHATTLGFFLIVFLGNR